MPSAEQILTGLLEYGKIQQPDAYKMMAAVLGLEFYSEEDSAPPIYTICSDTFVLDITPSSCNLMFVEESKGAEFASIQRYLDYYLQNKLVFYRLLKFFVSIVRLESGAGVSFPQDAASGPADLRQYKSICRCVLDGDYCFRSKISTIPAGYNIFTHRFESVPINSPLSELKDGAPPDDCAGIEQPVNLYDYFTTADFSAKVFSRWADRYECYYEGDGVCVSRGDVFLDGTKCRLASFAFKKGCSLRDALDVSSKIKQCSLIGNPYFQFFLFLVVAAVCYALYRVMSRMSSVRDLPRNPRGFSFKGVVTSVSDGDGFRVFHVPWMRNKAYSRSSPKLPVRLAGIDAPEMRFFGTPAQPFSKEAKELLSALALKKTVHVTVYSIDMYSRIVAMVCIKTGWFSWTNVNLEMVRAGLACVYDRAGAEYGGLKAAFEAAQAEAKRKKRGMWSLPSVVLPMDYKSRKR